MQRMQYLFSISYGSPLRTHYLQELHFSAGEDFPENSTFVIEMKKVASIIVAWMICFPIKVITMKVARSLNREHVFHH